MVRCYACGRSYEATDPYDLMVPDEAMCSDCMSLATPEEGECPRCHATALVPLGSPPEWVCILCQDEERDEEAE